MLVTRQYSLQFALNPCQISAIALNMTRSDAHRHLPVVGSPEPERDAPRPLWLWVLLGSIVIVSVWVPLALTAVFLGARIAASFTLLVGDTSLPSQSLFAMVPTALLVLLSFACASAIGGVVVGRFGDRPSRWGAGSAGVVSVLLVLLLAALGRALRPPLVGALVALCLLSIAVPLATLGGRWGRNRRVNIDD